MTKLVKSAVEPEGQRVQTLPEAELQIMNIDAIGKTANRLAETIMVIVQKRKTLGKTKKRRFIRRLRYVEIVLMLPNRDLKSVKPGH